MRKIEINQSNWFKAAIKSEQNADVKLKSNEKLNR